MPDVARVLELAEKSNVKFVSLWFTDVLGSLKSLTIGAKGLAAAFREGRGFDGSSIEGFARIDESDMVAMPDPNTFSLLPWRNHGTAPMGKLFCNIHRPDGEPSSTDPRGVLRRNLDRAAEMGFDYMVGPELEYFYFKNSTIPLQGLDDGGYFDNTPPDVAAALRQETVLALEAMGLDIDYTHHEVAPSQHEIDMHYKDAMTMADAVMMVRLVTKEIAIRNGYYATFMPKPIADVNGSGMHCHQSLWKDGRNAFFSEDDPDHLSEIGRQFLAGLLRHAREITIVTNQWVNSYKRLIPGYEAPVYVSWAKINRSDLVRIPSYREGVPGSVRMEYRAPDPACNPYLTFAVMLAAGLTGIEKGYELPPATTANVYRMTPTEREERGIDTLPGSLREAVAIAEESQMLRDALGPDVFEVLIENKTIEWDHYRAQVTSWELDTYLPIL